MSKQKGTYVNDYASDPEQDAFERAYSIMTSTNPVGERARMAELKRLETEFPQAVSNASETIFCETFDC